MRMVCGLSSTFSGGAVHPAEIKAALAIAGYSQAKLAEELGLAGNTVSMVVNGRGHSKQVEDRIAEVTRLAPAALWPQWYGEKPLDLTGLERELVLAFRAASQAARNRALRALGAGSGEEGTSYHVTADRGGIAAGRDVKHATAHEPKPPSYHKK